MHEEKTAAKMAERLRALGFEVTEKVGGTGVVGLLRVNSNPNRRHEDRQNVAFDFVIEPVARTGEPDAESAAVAWVPIDRLPPLDSLSFDHGDTVRAWAIPQSWAKGTASAGPAVSATPVMGRVRGVNVVIGTTDPRYVLHYDSASGHLRGTLNGAPFWAADIALTLR